MVRMRAAVILCCVIAVPGAPQVMPEMEGFKPIPGSRTMKTISTTIKPPPSAETTPASATSSDERAMSPVHGLSGGERMIADDVFATSSIAVEQMWPSRMMRARTRLDIVQEADNDDNRGQQTPQLLAGLAQELQKASVQSPTAAGGTARAVRAWVLDANIPLHDDDASLEAWLARHMQHSANQPDTDLDQHAGGSAAGGQPERLGSLVGALRRFELAALLAGERYLERGGGGHDAPAPPACTASMDAAVLELTNVQLHILPGGADAYELDHVAPDHALPSGVWCAQRVDEGGVPPLTLQLLDPRGDAPNM